MQSGEIIRIRHWKGDYYQIAFYAPEICRTARPGQFVHVKIANLEAHILRRPFSINDVDPESGALIVTCKVVGAGTAALAQLAPGTVCGVMGPLGNGYAVPDDDEIPVMIAGGYGAAAMYLVAKRAKHPGILLLGARSAADLILDEEYRKLGCEVRIATNDGSAGRKGLVTALLEEVLQSSAAPRCRFYACGPTPMLLAAGRMLLAAGRGDAELSLDQHMCCGVGACFACVVKVRDGESWRYSRSCKEGPVYPASEVYYGD